MGKFIISFIITALIFSCNKESDKNCGDPVPDCTGIQCFVNTYNFQFRIVDKNTGSDLVFGNNPRYTINDVHLFADAAHSTPIGLTADGNEKLFRTLDARTQMYLAVGTGNYLVTASFRTLDCCTFIVKDLRLDNQSVCTCCTSVIALGVN